MRASPADYKSALPACRVQLGAPCRLRHFLHGGRDAARSQGIVLAKMWCLGLGWCFWGDAHAGVSCRLQVGAPRSSSHEPPWLMGGYCQVGQEQNRLRSP